MLHRLDKGRRQQAKVDSLNILYNFDRAQSHLQGSRLSANFPMPNKTSQHQQRDILKQWPPAVTHTRKRAALRGSYHTDLYKKLNLLNCTHLLVLKSKNCCWLHVYLILYVNFLYLSMLYFLKECKIYFNIWSLCLIFCNVINFEMLK